ncbi:hypothetical protein C4579_01740 [Candidatus Microgenomates bacterium]|nr:MAG: hypothetical protein C4579_01740 [Candidatus Microgenomates bacterium]
MDNFFNQIKKNITSSIQNTSQTLGGIFGKAQQKFGDLIKPLVPEQSEFAIPGPTSGSYKPFNNLYVETAAQALGLGARDTDVLERLPSATIGALKGAGDGLAQALTFGWWNPEIKYANDIEKMAGDMTEVEFNVLGTIGTFVVGGGLVQGALKGVPLLARVATVAPKTFSLLSNGLTFAGLTQLQKEESYKNAQQRTKDFVSDFALGGAFSIAGMKPSFLKSSAIIGPATYVTSLIKGESTEDALKNTAAMMGLHSLNFAVAKYLPNKPAIEKQIEKVASEQLKITKNQALEYLGVNEKATADQVKQAWKNKVVGITKQFPAQANQTPQEMTQFNQAWNTANRAYEFLAKVSNPTGYTGKSFRQEFQDLYYDLWKNVPDKRAIIVRAVRNMPAGLSIRATLNDAQRSEIVTSLGGQEAKTRLGRVAELTDADLVTVAMENKIPVTPSKGGAPEATELSVETYKHGTPVPEKILKEGFSLADSGKTSGYGGVMGKGVYLDLTPGGEGAKLYGTVIDAKIKKGLKLFNWSGKIDELYTEATKYGDPEKIREVLQKKGYDGVKGLNQMVIFDPQNVVPLVDGKPSTPLSTSFSVLDQKAAKAAEIRDKYRVPGETELEKLESTNKDVSQSTLIQKRRQGQIVASEQPRADEVKDPPPGSPPRPPQETSIESDPPPPDGSALSQIDAMVGKLSPAANLLDKAKKAIQVFPRLFTNRFAPIREFENKVSKLQGKPIDINSSPYIGARMYAGRFGIVEGSFRDLYTALQPVRKLRADFTRYVLAQRTVERAVRGVENPLGVTQDTAEKALQELKAKVGDKAFQTFQQVGNGMQNWAVKAILEPMRDSGILSNNAFNAVVEKNKNWLPFHVLEYIPTLEEADKMAVGSETFSVSKQGVVSALEGTDKVIRDPFISVIDNLTKAVSLVERNKVALKLVELRKTHPDATKGLIRFLPNKENVPQDWESISVFIGGKVTRWAVPKELSEAMHAMSPAETGLMGKLVMMSSKAFKAGTTTLYFPFTLSNAVRDYQTASMVSKYGFNPAVWLSGFKDGFRSAFKWESKAYDEFMRNQGGYGSYIESTKGLAVASEQLFRPRWMERTKAVLNPFELIGNFSEAIELAPRLGIYKKALSKGATPFEAAFEARNVTVDFAKAGVEARLINMWVPFVNARWQGLLNVARVMKDNPIRTTARAIALTVLPGIATYFYNVMNHEELWDDIPQWAKDTYFIVIVGEDKDDEGNRVPKVVQIPKGDVGAIFFNPLMYAFEYVRKQEPQNLFKLGLEWMSQLAPVPFTRDGELSVQAFFSGALPPIIRTPVEIATNTNFFTGFPVVPRRLEKVAPSEQYDSRTPDLAITIGRALGVSPMKLTHAVYGLTGSLARELLSPADILGLTMDRFYRTHGGEKQRIAWDIKYDAEVGYNTTRLQMKKLVEEGNLQEAQQMALRWNEEAEKLIPQVVPLLMKDDPKEAALFQSSITFNASDLQRLLKTTLPGGIPQATDGNEQKSPLIPLKPGASSGDNQSIKSLIYR